MRHALTVGIGVAALAALAGCSEPSRDMTTPAPSAGPAAGRVSLDNNDIGPVTFVTCVPYDNDTMRITLEATPRTTVLLTDNATSVNMITTGRGGASGPKLTYVTGSTSSGMNAQVTRTDDVFTITGTGIGSFEDHDRPLLMPFEIVADCS